ncbi:hypothetical protein ACHHYP_20612 [Achlya hypogyna]|uniref:Tc1-like transposase DDE domain-containing protein n=1 Tax=Achlya hypogyna TaxID=1202772 RepID=A0A1V9ZGV4_ACHHY|nr:hypothetical protein ACHHYP_20612 [Achlya hypogyna]
MRWVLQRLGFRYLRGEKRNYLAESTANVAFCVQYIKAKLENRDSNARPIQSKVYLDESYINQNHTASRSQPKSDTDYHGKFTAQLFERCFHEMCETLEAYFGTCVIHLDGAKYHKRVLNPNPTTS